MSTNRTASRRLLLRRLIDERSVGSQQEMVRLLAAKGYRVTQATVSRDLAAIGVRKLGGQTERYALGPPAEADVPGDLARRLRDFVQRIDHSMNLVVLRTSPGAASPVASALDLAELRGVLGTVAGDDTVLVISRSSRGGSRLARSLKAMLDA